MVSPYPDLWELILAPIYIALGFLFIYSVPSGKFRKLFAYAMATRFVGGIVFLTIYLYYYGGGDTVAYFQSAVPIIKLIFSNPALGFRILFESYTPEMYSFFTVETGYPMRYIIRQVDTISLTKVLVPVAFLGVQSYLLTTLLLASISIIGPWRLYLTMKKIAPGSERISVFAILFFPSVIFWGCGISKDTYTFSATCLLVHVLYEQLIKRNYNVLFATLGVFAFAIILFIKPYILLVLLPGATLWFFFNRIQKIRNRFLRLSLAPITIFISSASLVVVLTQFGDALGEYSFDKILSKAIVTQQDLTQEYYGGNSFDIGEIEPTWFGVFQKFPIATFYGCFGPTLIQARNIVSLVAALENTFLLLLFVYIIFYQNPLKTFNFIFSHPFLVFCLSFSIMFAFSIGLTTANFGALVRFKIPMIPFFVLFLMLLAYKRPIND